MGKIIHFKVYTSILLSFVIFFLAWWLLINLTQLGENDIFRGFFSYTYGVVAFFGAFIGCCKVSLRWGGIKSVIGRAILMFAIGLFLQALGQLTYNYQIYVLKIENPYPSIGDIFFFSTNFFYAYGIWLVARASGAYLSLKKTKGKIIAVLIPALMLLFAYLSILHNYQFDRNSPLASFYNFGYPTVQAIYISVTIMAYILSKKWLGGIMKNTMLLILFVFIVQYIADFTFVYQTLNDTWQLSGSNDLYYLISYSLMTFTLIRFGIMHNKIMTAKE